MAESNKSGLNEERRFTPLKINLQGDDEDGTPYISSTWLNPKLDGDQFNLDKIRASWNKPNWMDDREPFKIPTLDDVENNSSDDDDDKDSSSDRSSRLRSPPTLRGYPQRPKSVPGLANILKAASKFKKGVAQKRANSLPLSAREDRLVFPGEPRRKKSTAAILAELRTPRRRTRTKVTFEEPENPDLDEVKRPTRKVTYDELDTIVSRLIRPTNASRARAATVRPRFFIGEKRPPEPKRVNYLMFAPTRFKGLRKAGSEEIEEITNRLNSFDLERWPPNSARGLRGRTKEENPVTNSYRWKGIKNC